MDRSELIKNKTLHFLAKSLPYLKEDMDSIPKVVKISKQEKVVPPTPAQLPSDLAGYYDYSHVLRKKRSLAASGGGGGEVNHQQQQVNQAKASPRGLFSSVNNWNLTLARQKACEQKDGM